MDLEDSLRTGVNEKQIRLTSLLACIFGCPQFMGTVTFFLFSQV
jgi:hypothetical protein